MNKKEFLKELEKSLKVLDTKEIKDILDEYENIIDEKVKNGKTEEEAVKDFGEISELVEEILSAYKINPEYGKDNGSFKKLIADCDVLIKKGASKLADASEKLAEKMDDKGSSSSIEIIFEIFIKIVIILFFFAVLRLPFEILIYFGERMLEIAFYPLDVVLISIWKLIVWVVYLISCAFIVYFMFQKYFVIETKTEVKKVTKKTTTKKTIKKEVKKDETKKEEINEIDNNSVSSILATILKIFIIMCFFIPLIFANVGIYMALAIVVFLVIKGINVIGLGVLLLGIAILFSYVLTIVENLLIKKRKIYSYPLVISAVLIIVGGLVFIEEAMRFDYVNVEPRTSLTRKTLSYEEEVDRETDILVDYGTKSYKIDNSIEDDKIILEISYYSDLIKTKMINYTDDGNKVIEVDTRGYKYSHKANRTLYKTLMNNLEDNKIYNYPKLFQAKVTVYANAKTMKLVK